MARPKTTTDIVTAVPTPVGPACVKCGSTSGWTGPRYQKGKRVTARVVASPTRFRDDYVETTESLDYECKTCGYVRHDATKDDSASRLQ